MSRKPRFRRRRRFGLFRILFKLAVILAGCWLAGFFWFAGWVLSAAPPNPMPHADGIVVLTGGDNRVSTALALLGAQDAPLLLISGVGHGTYLGDLTADDTTAATKYASRITLGHAASTTHTNATETALWVRQHGMHSLLIVTADYHMPRALSELGNAMPDVDLIGVPVRPPAMDGQLGLPTIRLLAGEYSKYLVVRAGLGSFAAGLTEPGP